MIYIPRAVDTSLKLGLESIGAVLLEGPRACGKTETGLHVSESDIRLDQAKSRQLAELSPELVLQGATPRLIDEWQVVPQIWNEVRREIDARKQPGQFVLSGSASPADDKTRHTGAGRFSRIRMRPFTLGEMAPSSTAVTLEDLSTATTLEVSLSEFSCRDLAEAAVRGGWPGTLHASLRASMRFARDYIENIEHADLSQLGTDFAPERVRRLLRSVARNVASEAAATTLSQDISADGGSTSPATVRKYLEALSRIFVLEELPAWSGSLRSKSRLRTAPRLNFCDPSLACAALQVSPEALAQDPEFFGQVFESMAVRDLRTYAEQLDASCFAYRDETNLEIDMLLEFYDGSWAGFEVKLGESERVLQQAERNLLRLAQKRMKTPPKFLAIITGGEKKFTLPSGIHVVPLALLNPVRE